MGFKRCTAGFSPNLNQVTATAAFMLAERGRSTAGIKTERGASKGAQHCFCVIINDLFTRK
jgi:hypothetical protein